MYDLRCCTIIFIYSYAITVICKTDRFSLLLELQESVVQFINLSKACKVNITYPA